MSEQPRFVLGKRSEVRCIATSFWVENVTGRPFATLELRAVDLPQPLRVSLEYAVQEDESERAHAAFMQRRELVASFRVERMDSEWAYAFGGERTHLWWDVDGDAVRIEDWGDGEATS